MKRILSVLFSLAFCFSLSACGGNDSNNKTPDQPPPLEDLVGSQSSFDLSSEQQILGKSDTLSAENFEFNIQSLLAISSVSNDLGVEYKPESGNIFLIAVITAKNISNETQNVANTNFNSFADGNKVVIQPIVGKIDGNFPLLGAVSVDAEFTGYTVWELPQDWETLQFSYIDTLTGSESNAFSIRIDDVD